MNYWTQNAQNIYVAGHRGWPARYPENTLESFQAAIELGIDQIETDVRVTKDGELVLIHDATVDRTTNGSGKVADYTLAQLKQLDAGMVLKDRSDSQSGHSSRLGQGLQIPTLLEFLDLVKNYPTLTMDIELKEYPIPGWEDTAYRVCDQTIALLEQYGLADRIVLNSFSGRLNEYILEKYGGKYKQHVYFPQSHLRDGSIDPYSYAYCTCVVGVDKEITADDIIALHRKTGVRIWAGASVKDEATIDKAVSYGAELITCNNPDEVLRILREKGLHS